MADLKFETERLRRLVKENQQSWEQAQKLLEEARKRSGKQNPQGQERSQAAPRPSPGAIIPSRRQTS
jgi:hypothetical protein